MKIVTKIIKSNLTHDIRKEILWPHITNNDYTLPIDNDKDTFHVGAYYLNNIISSGTFTKQKNKLFKPTSQYRLRAMATSEKYQKKGAGKLVFLKGLEVLKRNEIELIWCDSRINAIPFYKSLKMNCINKIYHIKNIGPHKTMYLSI